MTTASESTDWKASHHLKPESGGAVSKDTMNKDEQPKYSFLLFVASGEANSLLAEQNLRRLIDDHLAGHSDLQVIDVFQEVDSAINHNILVTPCLIVRRPLPQVMLVGNLSDKKQVLTALRLSAGGPSEP